MNTEHEIEQGDLVSTYPQYKEYRHLNGYLLRVMKVDKDTVDIIKFTNDLNHRSKTLTLPKEVINPEIHLNNKNASIH